MSEARLLPQAELLDIVQAFEALRGRLEGLAADLTGVWDDRPESDGAVAVADLIRCVIVDSVTPAIKGLRSAAEALESGGGEE
jgi:hypothetical protein